ncbi:hypothetical protein BIW11_12460 [Tropilaelaps mercedesae]|uniref:Uncharacterized protein n=1 Tax=Tropilaelaps mercedesae TaxID=418985 RepID=A0A1V9X6T5_9ACAR|nr:hypothetical protein BIW11_12460 [Tropilaelaps mercedesae]
MGRWELEAFRMAIYMAFPVGLFYYFNQPQYFEDSIIKTKREIFPPEHLTSDREMRELIRDFNSNKSQELKEKLKAFDDRK